MVGVAPLQTTTTPGTGRGTDGPSGMADSIPPSRTPAVQRVIAPVITFDVGQTLVELDLDFLCLRLGERGVSANVATLAAAAPAAWDHYDRLVDAGHEHPWHGLMDALLEGAGVASGRAVLVDWLWSEQPRKNLWRQPIAPMVELARDLAARGIRLGIVSNSEGRLAELLVEIAIAEPFATVVDSGRFGIAKPDTGSSITRSPSSARPGPRRFTSATRGRPTSRVRSAPAGTRCGTAARPSR